MKTLTAVFLGVLLTSCTARPLPEKDNQQLLPEQNISDEQRDAQTLQQLRAEIETLAGSERCDNAAAWKTIAMGAKACGGPQAYIAYPAKLDGTEFRDKVELYNRQSAEFNRKYGVMSDCVMVLPPAGVRCENGKAILIPNHQINVE